MTLAHEMPKVYLAISEWLSLLGAVWICRRYRVRKRWIWACAAALPLLCVIQTLCGPPVSFLWFAGMAAAAAVLGAALWYSVRFSLRETAYVCARAFILSEFAAALEWELDFYYHFDEISHLASLSFCAAFCVFLISLCAAIEYRSLPDFARDAFQEVSPTQLAVMTGIVLVFFAFSVFSYLGLYLPFTGKGEHEVFNIRMLMDFAGVITAFALNMVRLEGLSLREKLILQGQMDNQYAHYVQAQENREAINHKYHDLKHLLGVLRASANSPDALRLLDEFADGLVAYEGEFDTGHRVLDCILAENAALCREKSISLVVTADGALLEPLLTADICTIFGNALSNAIECEQTFPNIPSRRIRVELTRINDFIRILVENHFEGELKMKGGLPVSTKKEAEKHGYGLKSIRCTVEKYGGVMHIQTGDGAYRLKILLPGVG